MNNYTASQRFGKGVSLWIPITVFLAVLALVFTLLPSTSAQVQEAVMEDLTISETTESVVDPVQPAPVEGGDTLPEIPEEDPVVIDDVPAPEVIGEEDNSGLNGLLGLIAPQQIRAPLNWGNLAENIVIVGEGSNPGDPIRVGENVDISGDWNGRGLDILEGDSFEIQFPDAVSLIPLGFDLEYSATEDWGRCEPNVMENRYVCTIDYLPGVDTYGTWQASARASQTSTEYNIVGSDYSLRKEGGMIYLGGNLVEQPAGTVTRWSATIDAQAPVTLIDPIVLEDTFSSNLKVCESEAITNLEVRQGGVVRSGVATYVETSPTSMTITITPPPGGFTIGVSPPEPIQVFYQLCTTSGGLDPVGTEYLNTVEWGTLGADVTVTQTRSTSGTIVALDRGTFELNKVVNTTSTPPGATPIPGTITVQVEEFAPGDYPGGTPQATYDIQVDTNGTVINGQNSRPDGWTIRLTEIPPAEIPGFIWGDPVFSGTGIDTGVDAQGRAYAVLETTQGGNVALQLDNYLFPTIPEIGTTAQVQGSTDNVLSLDGGTVVDTVHYENLKPNTDYTLNGEIVAVGADGTVTKTGITATGSFTTGDAPVGQPRVSGDTTVTFTISAAQAAAWAGQKLVVYESLFEVGIDDAITEHRNPNDVAQTFWVTEGQPNIGTLAEVQDVNNPKLLPLTGGEVVDTVSYTFLNPETEYRLEGELMHVAANGTVTPTGITTSGEFTTPAAPAGQRYVSGTAQVTFTINAAQAELYGGQNLVVYEELYLVATDALITEHKDATDADQTFRVQQPGIDIGTSAATNGPTTKLLPLTGGQVVDTVSYTNLEPETEYRLEGELMHVDAEFNATPTGIVASAVFTTPAAPTGQFYVSGTTEVTFTITGDQAYEYGGQNLVVFEELYLVATGELIAEHKDENDEDQTFRVEDRSPEIGTRADVTGTTTKVLPITGGQVVDTVSYTDLFPETEYRLKGELMHVDGATVTPTGITTEGTFTTPAAPAGERYVSGTAQVTFTITAAQAVQYAGEKLVVFEELFDATTDEPVAEHKDPNDEDQSFDIEPGGEIIVDKTVTGPKGDDVENDDEAVFQVRADWLDLQGNEQSRTFNVTPGEPVSLEGLPLNTEITLTEVGANTSVGNVKWGEIIWSGEGVVDEPGASPSGVITITDPDAPIQVGLENKTSSNALIIIPIPLPLVPIGGGSSVPPAPVAPTPTTPAEAAPLAPEVSPKDGIQPPSPKDGIQPQRGAAPMAQQGAAPQTQRTGLASTGADVIWLAGGGIMILLLGTWLVLRGRRNES